MLLVREGDKSLDVPDLLLSGGLGTDADSQFDLLVGNQVITLQRNLFIFISPLLRSIFATILPCIKPQIILPSEVSVESVKMLQNVVQHFGDFEFVQKVDFSDLQQFDELVQLLNIKSEHFKTSLEDEDDDEFLTITPEDIENAPDYDIKQEDISGDWVDAEETESKQGMKKEGD